MDQPIRYWDEVERRWVTCHPAPEQPSADTVRRWDEFERQLVIYRAKRQELLQTYGSNRVCVFCCDELIGVYDSYQEAERAARMAESAHGTDVSLVGDLDMPDKLEVIHIE